MESRVSTSLKRSTRETWSVCERASVRTMKSKSAAVKRARQFALIIGNSLCARTASMASQIDSRSTNYLLPRVETNASSPGFLIQFCFGTTDHQSLQLIRVLIETGRAVLAKRLQILAV